MSFVVLLPLGTAAAELPPPAAAKVDFARDIRPLFERSCVSCHGPNRPKSGFRLDHREGAMKGGDNGKAILLGDSANSPLVLVVAGLHPDIERMPPEGKGEPLTPKEIGLLRTWIDQGAEWTEGASGVGPQTVASASPTVRWISVSGDEKRFREHFGMKEGFHAGLQNFFIQEKPSANSTLTLEGRLFPEDEDLRIALRYERANLGFISLGVDQFRKYYDDSGGYYPFTQPIFSLDRDLAMRIGKAWADFGLTLPDAPMVTLGYEYQFRQGAKSTLQWGSVKTTSLPGLPETSFEKKIYPAFKEVDERAHILKFDASHDFSGTYVEDNFRAEFYDLKTHRQNTISLTQGQSSPTSFELLDEAHEEFRAVNALRFEREIRDWWFISGGYLHSNADADASFRQNTVHATGLPIAGDFWRIRSIILSQHSVLLNGNMRLGPWENLTFSGGVQSEWLRQEGVGRVNFDTGNPAILLTLVPATIDANLHKHTLQERAALRYTGLPFTSMFAEGRLEQETAGTFEQQSGGQAFLRDTDAESDTGDWRVGFYSSPSGNVSFGGHYWYRDKNTDYNHRLDDTPGYPAFIRARRIDTHEIEGKLTVHPFSWLKSTLTYQILDTDFDSATAGITNITPGGPLHAGTFNANVYGASLFLTPFPRWNFSGTFHFYDSRSASAQNEAPLIIPSRGAYRGEIYGLFASATYMLSTNTDLTASYSWSRSDFAHDDVAAGLPAGINYDWHVVQGGIARRFKGATAHLQYAFYQFEEPTTGFNDYTAHAVFATLTLHWP